MRAAWLVSLLAVFASAGCGSSGSTDTNAQDASVCTGLPPMNCIGCCGSKYTATVCTNGEWTCAPLAATCPNSCDAGGADSPAPDSATSDSAASDSATSDSTASDAAAPDSTASDSARPDSTASDSAASDSASLDAAATDAPEDARQDAPPDALGCTGLAPFCFGNDSTRCCANDPGPPATCVAGVWSCGSSPAPGCNGARCIGGVDGG